MGLFPTYFFLGIRFHYWQHFNGMFTPFVSRTWIPKSRFIGNRWRAIASISWVVSAVFRFWSCWEFRFFLLQKSTEISRSGYYENALRMCLRLFMALWQLQDFVPLKRWYAEAEKVAQVCLLKVLTKLSTGSRKVSKSMNKAPTSRRSRALSRLLLPFI